MLTFLFWKMSSSPWNHPEHGPIVSEARPLFLMDQLESGSCSYRFQLQKHKLFCSYGRLDSFYMSESQRHLCLKYCSPNSKYWRALYLHNPSSPNSKLTRVARFRKRHKPKCFKYSNQRAVQFCAGNIP